MTRIPKLTEAEINAALAGAPGWAVADGHLAKRYKFRTFVQSLQFVNAVGAAAEAAHHHPDLEIHYNQVVVKWVTWGAGGITQLDFDLARRCDEIYAATPQ